MPPRRRPAVERRRDFEDVCLPYTAAQARWEAARCFGCTDAPCRDGCHAAVDVRRFVRLLQHGDPLGAADAIRRTNVLGGSCARVCDAGRGCMARCIRGSLDAPVDIAGLEWFAMETARQAGLRPLPVGTVSGRTVAILGSGPAGLAAAAELRRRGHGVVLYEERSLPGGSLTWGIPPYRLPRSMVEAEIESVLGTGIELRTGQSFDSLDSLLQHFDAVVLAVGLSLSTRLGVDGEDLGGVFPAAAVLDGTVEDVGLRPVVVGGGNPAIDAAATAIRLAGPRGRVSLIYRRGFQHLPGREAELRSAIEAGVVFRPFTFVERILADAEGNVAMLRCRAVQLGEPDGSGRPEPLEIGDASFDIPASSVIVAAGEAPDLDFLLASGLPDEEPRCDERGRSEVKGLYLAGDVAGRGHRSVSWAVASGRHVAEAIDEDLERERAPEGPYPVLGPHRDLSVSFAGKTLPNPFLLSASLATDELDMARAALRAGWAGVVLRTATLEGVEVVRKHPSIQPIADGPRLMAALASVDVVSSHHADVIEHRVAAIKEEFPDRLVAASIAADGREAWQKLAKRLSEVGVDALECNASCLQGSLGAKPRAMLGEDPKLLRTVTRWIKDVAPDTPVFVKLVPHVADVAEAAAAVAEGGGAGVTAVSAVPALGGVDIERCVPLPSVGGRATYSGLSGPAVLPIALRAVAEAARAAKLQVSGSGGVGTYRDALAMMMMGATTVQVCTEVMHRGLDLIQALRGGVARFMERHGIDSAGDLVGRALPGLGSYEELVQPGAVRAKIDVATCLGCGRCHVACRDGAHRAIDWDPEGRYPSVSLERCVGCGLCAGVCPSDSIGLLVLGA